MFRQKLLASSIVLATSLCALPAMGITLEEATYKAVETNPAIRQAIALYRESLENTEVSRRNGYYPSIDLNAGIGHETTYDYQGSGEDVSLTRRELALTLTQPIFSGFSTSNDVKRLRAEAEANRWNALIQVENKALEVARAYTDVLRNRELYQLAQTNLDTHNRIYQQIRTASESGVGRQSDFSQITARLAKAQANRLSAIDNLRAAEANYVNVVGEMPPTDLIYPEPDRSMLPKTLEQAIDQALKNNPAIDSAQWDVKATEHVLEGAKSSFYPELNFVVERTFDDNIDGAEGSDEDLTAMLRLSYNLYSGGADKRAKSAANQQNIQASEIKRNTIRETELSARLAWAAYEASLGSKNYLQQYVTATKESQLAYAQQFNLGRRTLLDVLDSENELFEARQDYVNADYDELYAEFRLFNSKGDLMRALRIYQPEELGFEQKQIARERTAVKASEITAPVESPVRSVTPAITQETNAVPVNTQTSPVAQPATFNTPAYQAAPVAQPQYRTPPATSQPSFTQQAAAPSYQAPATNSFPQGNTSVSDDGVIFIDATENSGGW